MDLEFLQHGRVLYRFYTLRVPNHLQLPRSSVDDRFSSTMDYFLRELDFACGGATDQWRKYILFVSVKWFKNNNNVEFVKLQT